MSEPIKTAKLIKVYGKKVWVESCPLTGSRHVMVQHDAPGEEPFCYASFHYDYRHTCNSGTWGEARRMAVSLGATEPVEERPRAWPTPQPVTPAGGEVDDDTLRVFRKLADDVHGRFFWMLSPADDDGTHKVSHESVLAVLELCGEIEQGTPAYENLSHPPVADAALPRGHSISDAKQNQMASALVRMEGLAIRWYESAQNDKHEQRASAKQKCAADLRALIAALNQRGGGSHG